MTTKRTNIIQALIDRFVDDGVVEASNVTRRLVFLHECNDFPSICAVPGAESRSHYGNDRRIAQLSVNIRAFSYNGDDAVGAAESLARDIEASVDAYASSRPDIGLYEARVISVRTDEGLFDPHGIADLTIQITYEV